MTNVYEQRYLINLAFMIAYGFTARSVVVQKMSGWVEDKDLGFHWDPEIDSVKDKGVPTSVWSNLRRLLTDRFSSAGQPKLDVLVENVTLFAEHVALSAGKLAIFELAVRARRFWPAGSRCKALLEICRAKAAKPKIRNPIGFNAAS